MKPHPTYRTIWLVQQGIGVAGAYGFGWWGEYFVLTALLEAVGLTRKALGKSASGTWSWVVWEFIGTGAGTLWRTLVVALWSVWFALAFALYGWFTPDINALLAFGFLVWLWAHFLGRRN